MARVLVVDDDASVLLLAKVLLSRAGHTVVTAASLPDAEAVFLGEPCAIVVTDKNLPGATGFDVIERLRRHAPDLPAILMTAYPEPLLGTRTRLQGYLAKPFERASLLVESVERVLAFETEKRRPPPLRRASAKPMA
jgi:CheY-like chemotaxis protein